MKFINKLAGCFLLFIGVSTQMHAQGKPIDLMSPNGELKVSISLGDKIYYNIAGNSQEILTKNHLALTLKDGVLGENPKLLSVKKTKSEEIIKPYIPLKFSTVKSNYNDLLMTFKGNYAVEFRAFDDCIAYRFITSKKGDAEVMNEDFSINFPDTYLLHLQQNNGNINAMVF
jgi:alpha-glucosidase